MRNYDVYFDIFGKKLKVTRLAENKEDAKEQVRSSIVFHKVVKSNEEFNKSMDLLDGIINILNSKKHQ